MISRWQQVRVSTDGHERSVDAAALLRASLCFFAPREMAAAWRTRREPMCWRESFAEVAGTRFEHFCIEPRTINRRG